MQHKRKREENIKGGTRRGDTRGIKLFRRCFFAVTGQKQAGRGEVILTFRIIPLTSAAAKRGRCRYLDNKSHCLSNSSTFC